MTPTWGDPRFEAARDAPVEDSGSLADRVLALEDRVKRLELGTTEGMLQEVYDRSDPELQKFIRGITGFKP